MPTNSKTDRLDPLDAALAELGLSEYERKLYALSLSLGPTSVTTMAEHLGISRPNVYKVIAGLETHGLAEFQGGKTYQKRFFVESPSTVAELLKKKKEAVDALDRTVTHAIPELMELYEQGRMPAKTKVLRGKKEFLQAYVQVFEEAKDEILFFGSLSDFLSAIGRDFGQTRIGRRTERRVPIRVLSLPGTDATEYRSRDKQELRTTRYLKNAASFKTSFYLFSNKAIFWQPETPVAILIEDEYLVAMWRGMFNLLWENCSD